MSKKDYTKFSNNFNKPVSTQVDETLEIVEPVTEVEGVVTSQIDEPVQEVKVIEPIKEVKGVVVDCLRLNVRKAPDPKAEILCAIDAATDLMIDEEQSTRDFYKVCTAAGVEGYCMKKFVSIMP